jgi:uncharacterized membrane protein
MSKLDKALHEWTSLGFLSPDQASRIKAHEASKPESSWVLSGLLILGVLIIGIGVISLIAANWGQIPASVKLSVDFLMLATLVVLVLRSWESQKSIQFEVLLLFFLLLCMGSIGLISQVFHTGGKLYQALLFWSVITFGAALAARKMFIHLMWAGILLGGVAWAAMDSELTRSLFYRNSAAVFLMIPLLAAALTVASKSFAGETSSTRSFRAWTLIWGLLGLSVIELRLDSPSLSSKQMMSYSIGYALAGVTALGIWTTSEYSRLQKLLLLSVLGLFLIPFHLHLIDANDKFAFAVFTIAILALMSLFLASLGKRVLFQCFLSLLGLRFLFLYFQALGGLGMTGVGLIVSGGVVIGMAVLWHRYRTSLAVWAERWAK